MEAGTLQCPSCGAAVSSDSPNCLHCGARLAKIACPGCFAMVFQGAKFCPHCGVALAEPLAAASASSKAALLCPRCESPSLSKITLRETPLDECAKCSGIWLDNRTFESICADRERQAALLGNASDVQRAETFEGVVRYLRCPQCREFMSRVNFGKCSGVIIDACRAHGTWFDRDELQRIVEFIRSGGMDLVRERQKAELDEARRRLEAAKNRGGYLGPVDGPRSPWPGYNGWAGNDLVTEAVVQAAGAILRHWF
jgi:Zn-finger nucleic acid-binding protein